MQCVEVKLELGHRATQKTKPTPEGFTHDWCVFVRGPDKLSIQHFVEKVVFHLHESFPKPKRVIKEPPYQVSESGYAGFMFPIEVYFRNKEEPKKVVLQYDLYLRLEGPVSNTRAEKLTFQNPTEEFRKKLLKAGGVAVTLNPAGGTIPTIQPQPPPSQQYIKGVSSSEAPDHHPQVSSKQPASKTTSSSEIIKEKKPKLSPIKDGGKLGGSSHPGNQPFTDIFGPVLKTQSPTSGGKQKEGPSAKPGSGTPKSSKSSQGGSCSVQVSSSSKETKPPSLPKDKNKHHKESRQHKELKSHNKEGKEISKRPESPTQGLNSSVTVCKKRKRTTSTSSVASSVMSVESFSKDKQHKDKKEKKENHQKPQNKSNISENAIKKEKEQEKSSKQVTQSSSNSLLKTKYDPKKKKEKKEEKKGGSTGDVKNSSAIKPKKIKEKLSPEPVVTESFEQTHEDGNSSPASSISLSSLATGGTHGPLAAMMAEMEKDNELLSPLSSCPDSPVETSLPKSKEALDLSDEETDTKINREEKVDTAKASKVKKERKDFSTPKHEKNHIILSEEASEQVSETKSQKSNHRSQFDPSYLAELEKLRQQIMSLRDRGHIQRVVDVIEQTGLYFVTDSTFDFDLCCLDKNTIRKLQNCLTVK
ncbi:ENL/AF9-related superfamily elongation complex transcription factor [Tachypleus tridentatus]|uniref:ENL/AF9-related superfamily elongation complex transcription factor n=1 Tax=Tachypleus tridentatus TaxID=6853 RepID=UPI003FD1F8F9